MIVIGVDPDAKKHGVAIFNDGVLVDLAMWDIADWIHQLEVSPPDYVSIENVMANKPVFSKKGDNTEQKKLKIAQDVGRCKQAQVELTRVLEYYNVPMFLTKPTRQNWAKKPGFFKKATKWTGSSNIDTRSAAYFGWLAVNAYISKKG